jgi:hypothetical protein
MVGFREHHRGTFSLWPLSLVDRADSLLLNVGEWLGSNLNAIRELRPSYCRYVHWWNCPRLSAASEKVPEWTFAGASGLLRTGSQVILSIPTGR